MKTLYVLGFVLTVVISLARTSSEGWKESYSRDHFGNISTIDCDPFNAVNDTEYGLPENPDEKTYLRMLCYIKNPHKQFSPRIWWSITTLEYGDIEYNSTEYSPVNTETYQYLNAEHYGYTDYELITARVSTARNCTITKATLIVQNTFNNSVNIVKYEYPITNLSDEGFEKPIVKCKSNLIASVGDSVAFTCNVTASYISAAWWEYELEHEERGEYYPFDRASNLRNIEKTVSQLHPWRNVVNTFLKSLARISGRTSVKNWIGQRLRCSFEKYNSGYITNDDKTCRVPTQEFSKKGTATLKIPKVVQNDFRRYTVFVRNKFGTSWYNVQLIDLHKNDEVKNGSGRRGANYSIALLCALVTCILSRSRNSH